MRNRTRLAAAIAMVGVLALGACGGGTASEGEGTGGGSGSKKLSLVAFSVTKSAYDTVTKDFAATDEGKGTSWKTSYGASGDQSRAVVSGLEADFVHFSLEGDVTRLVDEGLVADDWDQGETKGILTNSVVVFVVRKGNPKGIKTWSDLVKDGVGIVSPNPGSSGSARWNILAAYGQILAEGGTKAEAEDYLTKFFTNVVALPGSGREATTAFTSGTGDVLISYENEAILARQSGEDLDYIVPDATLLIENPAAVTKGAPKAASDFLDYALGKDGQADFVKKGFRPVIDGVDTEVDGANDPSDPFPTPSKLFTIADQFGGWSKANDEFFDEDEGLVPQIQKDTGKN